MATKELKCKIKDAAKDLELTPNDIIAIVKERTGAEKKSGQSLTVAEMNIVLEHITQGSQVDNFDAYFAARDNKPAAKKEPEKEKAKPAKSAPEEKKADDKGKTDKPAKAADNTKEAKPSPSK